MTSHRAPKWAAPSLAALAIAAVLTGCGAPATVNDAALRSAQGFTAAVTAGQFTTACTELAPETRTELEADAKANCVTALRSADLTTGGATRHIDVYGQQARVEMAEDTLFLAQLPGGWKVTAAGCQPRNTTAYDCTVKGG
jgi:hypothetical protein